MSADAIYTALETRGCRVNRTSGMCQCPAHEDDHASLHVTDGTTVLVKCFAGCTNDSIMAVLGLTWAGVLGTGERRHHVTTRRHATETHECVMPVPAEGIPFLRDLPGMPAPLAQTTHRWRFLSMSGDLLWGVLRWEFPDGKEMRPLSLWRARDTGSLMWRLACPPRPRPLYGLDALDGRDVLVVEGEKTRDAAAILAPHLACVTWHGGADAVPAQDWTPLRGRNILIWPDADEAGQRAAQAIRDIVSGRIIEIPPDLPRGWDLADAPPAGFDPRRLLERDSWAPDIRERRLLVEVLLYSPRFDALRESDCRLTNPVRTVAGIRNAHDAWLTSGSMEPSRWLNKWA